MKMNELTKRIIVAAIGIPLGIILMYFGGIVFNIVILLISLVAIWEFYELAKKKGYPAEYQLGIALGIIPMIPYMIFTIQGDLLNTPKTPEEIGLVLFVCIFILLLVPLFLLFKKKENYLAVIGVTFMGFFYVSLPFFFLVLLRNLDNGFYWTILTFATIWICDSAAFFFGRKFGKHKLAPSISPNKSIEGAVTGFVVSAASFILAANYLISEVSLIKVTVIGIVIGIFGQLGDLIESKLKRDVGVKDSSNIIPGHGGILDRFDSIIFVIPFVYLIIQF